MCDFKEGQEIWLLEKPNVYRPYMKQLIKKCIYRGRNSVQYINSDGGLGMTKSIGDDQLFETLEELKIHIISKKKNEIQELERKITWLNEDIEYALSLKDVREDREKKINDLFSF